MGKITDGLINIGLGMVMIVEVPKAMVKAAVGKVMRKPAAEMKIEETKVDIKDCEPAAQEWVKRCYNKKNGIA